MSAFEPHREGQRYRARVEDREGDRWAVIGPLAFLGMHCADHGLRIVWIKPLPEAVATTTVKDYHVQCNIGQARYVVNFHDGVKTHPDGSKFYDIRIARNKRELNAIVEELRRSGYTER